jgi:MFS family permease
MFGGWLADRYHYKKLISLLFFGISLSLLLLIVSDRAIALFFVSFDFDVRITSLLLSTLLLAPSIFLLACIFPVVAKKCVTDLKTDGTILGKLSMISTYGSLIGIGLPIFIMIPYF